MRRWFNRFRWALEGLVSVLWRESSGRVHAAGTMAVAGLGLWLQVTAVEWAVLSLACGAVIGAEVFNSAIERLADRVTTEREEAIRFVKNAAAGAVLAAVFGATGAGLAVFGPRLLAKFSE